MGAAGPPPGELPGSDRGQAGVARPAEHSWNSCWPAGLKSEQQAQLRRHPAQRRPAPPPRPRCTTSAEVLWAGGPAPRWGALRGRGPRRRGESLLRQWASSAAAATASTGSGIAALFSAALEQWPRLSHRSAHKPRHASRQRLRSPAPRPGARRLCASASSQTPPPRTRRGPGFTRTQSGTRCEDWASEGRGKRERS